MALPTNQEYDEFRYILNIHKSLVSYLGKIFNAKDYSTHDFSKLSEPELTPYTVRFIRGFDVENPGWKEAKEHHFSNNDHHIEYWKYYAKKEMPDERLSEAVIDMMAAKFQYNLCKEVVNYVRVNQFEVDNVKLIEKVNEFLRKPEMYFFLDKYLSEYSDEQKKVINSKLQDYKKKFSNLHEEL